MTITLAGVGGLFLTCTSTKSHNYAVGYRPGKGETLDHIVKTLGSVAEGVSAAKGCKEAIDRVGVEAPFAPAVYSVLYKVVVRTGSYMISPLTVPLQWQTCLLSFTCTIRRCGEVNCGHESLRIATQVSFMVTCTLYFGLYEESRISCSMLESLQVVNCLFCY